MKRWLLRLGLAVFTFTLGCGVYFFSTAVWINRLYNLRSLEPLPYCQVARNAEWYHNNEILVNARIYVDESGVYVFEDCDPEEALAAGVVVADAHPLIGPAYVEKLLLTGDKPLKTAQALIRGRFDAYASTGCWAPKFQIHAEHIELLSALTDDTTLPTEETPTRIKH